MQTKFVFPGSFSPPTYGHLRVVQMAAEVLPFLTVVCSRNPSKDYWFSEDECAKLWSGYELPGNVDVTTFTRISREKIDFNNLVMVRGLRSSLDLKDEAKVLDYNLQNLKITKYFYLVTEYEYCDVSSSEARKAAHNLDLPKLSRVAAPRVVGALLEKVVKAKNIIMVVGRPGGGKSVILEKLESLNPSNVWINTDDFNHVLRPKVWEAFPNEDLTTVALNKPEELKEVIGKLWLSLLAERLRQTGINSSVFVEVPYGLRNDMKIFRYLTDKVLYIGCNERDHKARILERGTPEHLPFVANIPGPLESKAIADNEKLRFFAVDTSGQERSLELASFIDRLVKKGFKNE